MSTKTIAVIALLALLIGIGVATLAGAVESSADTANNVSGLLG